MKISASLRLLMGLAIAASCASAARAQATGANLPEADALVTFNVGRVVNEAFPRVLSAEQLASVQSALAKAKQVAGFDIGSIDSAVVALRFNRSAPLSRPDILVVAHGSFNADALLSLLKIGLPGKYREEKYGAKTLTLLKAADLMKPKGPAATATPEEIALVALDGGTLAAGIPAYVKAAVDADGGKNRIKPELVQLAARESSALISVAGLVPAGFLSGIVPKEAQGNEEITRLLGSIEQVLLALNMDAQAFPASLVLKINTADNARTIAGLLQTIIQFGSASVTDKNAKTILESIKITSQDTEVQVRTLLPQDMVASFVRGLFTSSPKPAETKSEPKPEAKPETKKP